MMGIRGKEREGSLWLEAMKIYLFGWIKVYWTIDCNTEGA
jgi:hypothetical protein